MKKIFQTLSLFLLLYAAIAQAGIQLDSTRVIYPAGKREVTIGLTNQANSPRLLQVWIDNGSHEAQLETASVPFVVMPPIFRVDPDKGQSLRITYTGGSVPQDLESVFWLNVLELQPKPSAKIKPDNNWMKFSVRTRIKLFYRPDNLPGSPEEAASQLRWQLLAKDGGYVLLCENPTAFNASFNHLGLKSAPADDGNKQRGMCPAKGNKAFTLPGKPTADDSIIYTTIDDFGGYHDGKASYRH